MRRAGERVSRGPGARGAGARRRWAPLGRPLCAASLGVALALLVPFGCGVDHRPPGLSAADTATSGAGASSGAGGNGGSGAGAGPATPCECVLTAYHSDDNPCSVCLKKVATAGEECASHGIDCVANAACAEVIICLADCATVGGEACVRDCLYPAVSGDAQVKFLALLACGCAACGSICARPEPVACDPPEVPDAGPEDAMNEASDDAG